jgi:methyltransferase
MTAGFAVSALTVLVVLVAMAGEAALSARNARLLRAQGAVEPVDDVYNTMRWAYPASFIAMALEGAVTGASSPAVLVSGIAVFSASKALKLWAIATLGVRWTYRVLALSGAPLIACGPYAFMRHPNYLAVLGELLGIALIVGAPATGVVALLGFAALLRRRIAIEDRALGRE